MENRGLGSDRLPWRQDHIWFKPRWLTDVMSIVAFKPRLLCFTHLLTPSTVCYHPYEVHTRHTARIVYQSH
jgi:hypothetical protein